MTYFVGKDVRVRATFTPVGSTTPTDPSTVVFRVKKVGALDPTIVEKVYLTDVLYVAKFATGIYDFTYQYPSAGKWRIIAIGTGPVNAIGAHEIDVADLF